MYKILFLDVDLLYLYYNLIFVSSRILSLES